MSGVQWPKPNSEPHSTKDCVHNKEKVKIDYAKAETKGRQANRLCRKANTFFLWSSSMRLCILESNPSSLLHVSRLEHIVRISINASSDFWFLLKIDVDSCSPQGFNLIFHRNIALPISTRAHRFVIPSIRHHSWHLFGLGYRARGFLHGNMEFYHRVRLITFVSRWNQQRRNAE